MALSKLFHLLEPQFPHLSQGVLKSALLADVRIRGDTHRAWHTVGPSERALLWMMVQVGL